MCMSILFNIHILCFVSAVVFSILVVLHSSPVIESAENKLSKALSFTILTDRKFTFSSGHPEQAGL